ncbi:hypothetical protein AAC387_Pa02g5149 [Persea americana]
MATSYYHPNRPYQAPPIHLCFFLLTLFLLVGLSCYVRYGSFIESIADQTKLAIMVGPLVLIMAVHWLSSTAPSRVPCDRESFHRVGSSPWGVGIVLIFLIFMISYQSLLP